MSRSTISDVARRAGVSVATVSRVVNNSAHRVGETTRRRVLEAVRDLNYHPDILAQGLITGASRVVALLVHDITDPYFQEIVRGAESVAARAGYMAFLCNTDRNLERERAYLIKLQQHRTEGVIVVGAGFPDDTHLTDFPDIRRRMVLVGRRHVDAPSVEVNNYDGARRMTEFLISVGHRSIAYIGGPQFLTTSQDRLRGFQDAMAEAGIRLKDHWIVAGDYSPQGGDSAAEEIFRRKPHPTAVFAANDRMAIGVYAFTQRSGLRIPADVSVTGFGDIDMATYLNPSLTTLRIPLYQMGEIAMQNLLRALGSKDQHLPVTRQLVDTELIERDSVRRIKKT